ncbi:hypothetical protein HRbin33_02358 [bacterium HR33]|nr:hypothetical protein HRbin33_02358 [bacterium HR33]
MQIAILDPAAGISGDMLLGALVDVGPDPEWLLSLPGRLGFGGVKVDIRAAVRCGVRATKVDFQLEHHGGQGIGGHGAHVAQLIELVDRAPVSPWVKERAVRAFRLIGEAEGRVHGVPAEKVHLHEVGAVDAVLDIVGCLEGFERLGVDAVYNLPVAVGSGWVEASHGKLPLPAPATGILLEGWEVSSASWVEGEATTPTGAALLRVLSRGAPPSRWRIVRSGWGAGTRDPKGYPNALRLILAEAAAEAAEVETIVTDIDDLPPEYVEPLREALLAAGALDCTVWAAQGKKGRVSLRIEVLAPLDAADGVVKALFENSTTAGVRRWRSIRNTLARREVTVDVAPEVSVRLKVTEGPSGPRLKAEYQDVIRAADRLKRPPLDIAREAERRAYAALGDGAGKR